MSTSFTVRTRRRVGPDVFDLGLSDLRWKGNAAPDPLQPGLWGLYRDRVSTRVTQVEYELRRLKVTINAGACEEDCDLAIAIVRSVARDSRSKVDTEFGPMDPELLQAHFDAAWARQQLDSTARILIRLVPERGPVELPGPTRTVVVGPGVVEELEQAGAAASDRLVEVMRRVLWPDPACDSAAILEVRPPQEGEADRYTLTFLLPERRCVLPRTDRVAVRDSEDMVFLIPWEAVAELPLLQDRLDDGNRLVEAVSADRWGELCRVARSFEITG